MLGLLPPEPYITSPPPSPPLATPVTHYLNIIHSNVKTATPHRRPPSPEHDQELLVQVPQHKLSLQPCVCV